MARPVLAAGLAQTANVLREVVHRIARAPDFVRTLSGSRRSRTMRIAVRILRDESGEPVASPADVAAALAEARRVLRDQAGVDLVAAVEPETASLDGAAPTASLDSPCVEGWWRADLGPGGAYFRGHAVRGGVTVFVIRDVVGRAGCSLGPLTAYVTIDRRAFGGSGVRVLAHELGHACGLPHSKAEGNLMFPRAPGERLAPWQAAVFRGSRHVTAS